MLWVALAKWKKSTEEILCMTNNCWEREKLNCIVHARDEPTKPQQHANVRWKGATAWGHSLHFLWPTLSFNNQKLLVESSLGSLQIYYAHYWIIKSKDLFISLLCISLFPPLLKDCGKSRLDLRSRRVFQSALLGTLFGAHPTSNQYEKCGPNLLKGFFSTPSTPLRARGWRHKETQSRQHKLTLLD